MKAKPIDINAQIVLIHSSVDAASQRLGYISPVVGESLKEIALSDAHLLLIKAKLKLIDALKEPT